MLKIVDINNAIKISELTRVEYFNLICEAIAFGLYETTKGAWHEQNPSTYLHGIDLNAPSITGIISCGGDDGEHNWSNVKFSVKLDGNEISCEATEGYLTELHDSANIDSLYRLIGIIMKFHAPNAQISLKNDMQPSLPLLTWKELVILDLAFGSPQPTINSHKLIGIKLTEDEGYNIADDIARNRKVYFAEMKNKKPEIVMEIEAMRSIIGNQISQKWSEPDDGDAYIP